MARGGGQERRRRGHAAAVEARVLQDDGVAARARGSTERAAETLLCMPYRPPDTPKTAATSKKPTKVRPRSAILKFQCKTVQHALSQEAPEPPGLQREQSQTAQPSCEVRRAGLDLDGHGAAALRAAPRGEGDGGRGAGGDAGQGPGREARLLRPPRLPGAAGRGAFGRCEGIDLQWY